MATRLLLLQPSFDGLLELVQHPLRLRQIDDLLRPKLRGSGLEPYIEVIARIEEDADPASAVVMASIASLSAWAPRPWMR